MAKRAPKKKIISIIWLLIVILFIVFVINWQSVSADAAEIKDDRLQQIEN